MNKKHAHNHIAESRLTLPLISVYGLVIWLLNGFLSPFYPLESKGLTGGAWGQLGCFVLSTALMVFLNNSQSLIRIYSRMVSASFVVLSCVTCFLFNSMDGAIVGLCVIAAYFTAFRSFQDKQATGWIFYTFVCISLGSLLFVQLLYFVPIVWLLMLYMLNSLSWRTFFASILGLITPYWFIVSYLLYKEDFSYFITHFQKLAEFPFPYDYAQLTIAQVLSFAFIVLLALTGIIHYLRNRINDKIRTRQLYSCFICMALLSIAYLAVQPQHYDCMMHILIINTSPLIAHFFALSYTHITEVAFRLVCLTALILTIFSLCLPSLTF